MMKIGSSGAAAKNHLISHHAESWNKTFQHFDQSSSFNPLGELFWSDKNAPTKWQVLIRAGALPATWMQEVF